MTEARFKIVFEGQLMPEVSLDAAKDNLARLFKSDRTKIDGLFSGAAVALKRDLGEVEANKYLSVLRNAGVDVRKEPDLAASMSLVELDDPKTKTTTARMTCPKCDHEQMQAVECAACGIVVEKFLARQAFLAKNPVAEKAETSPYSPPQSQVEGDTPAVSTLNVFTVQGRIGRLRYLGWSMATMLIFMPVLGIAMASMALSSVLGIVLTLVVSIIYIVVSVFITAQRLHDMGWTSWLMLVPGVALIMLFVPGTEGANRFGAAPPPNSVAVKVLSLLWLAFPVLLGILGALAIPAYQSYVLRAQAAQSAPAAPAEAPTLDSSEE
ncbi:MAG: DUF805 domain-containing protein [Pseudomonadota bacterium]